MNNKPVGPDLFMVAGFPNSSFRKLSSELAKLPFRKFGTFLCARAKNAGNIYNSGYVDIIENELASFVQNKISEDTPQRLTILYVGNPSSQLLFKRCHLYSALVEIPSPKTPDWKFQISPSLEAIENALSGPRPEPLPNTHWSLLPPINFKCKSRQLTDLLYAYASGRVDGPYVTQHLAQTCYTSTDLPKMIRNGKKTFWTDSRGLAYPPCKKREAHGVSRNDRRATNEHFLSGHFRFGQRLPNGFHFDAQYPNKNTVKGTTFHCSITGDITAQRKHSHANIYTNDLVRLGKKKGS